MSLFLNLGKDKDRLTTQLTVASFGLIKAPIELTKKILPTMAEKMDGILGSAIDIGACLCSGSSL
jgi:hypothetical protein